MAYSYATLAALVLCFSVLIGLPAWAEGSVGFVVLVLLGAVAGAVVVCVAWLGASRSAQPRGRTPEAAQGARKGASNGLRPL